MARQPGATPLHATAVCAALPLSGAFVVLAFARCLADAARHQPRSGSLAPCRQDDLSSCKGVWALYPRDATVLFIVLMGLVRGVM